MCTTHSGHLSNVLWIARCCDDPNCANRREWNTFITDSVLLIYYYYYLIHSTPVISRIGRCVCLDGEGVSYRKWNTGHIDRGVIFVIMYSILFLALLVLFLYRSRRADVLCACPLLLHQCLESVCVNRPATGWAMASRNSDSLCEKQFYGERKHFRCCERYLHFHCSCLQTSMSKCNMYTSTGNPTYKFSGCKTCMRATTN
jgi:hypothetical protein